LPEVFHATAFIAEIHLKPLTHPHVKLLVRASIEFVNENKKKFRINDAVWEFQADKYVTFFKGDTHPLVLALLPSSSELTMYEHNLTVDRKTEGQEEVVEFTPRLTEIAGKAFDVGVELIGGHTH